MTLHPSYQKLNSITRLLPRRTHTTQQRVASHLSIKFISLKEEKRREKGHKITNLVNLSPSTTEKARNRRSRAENLPGRAETMGQFDWLGSVGASDQAVAVLNDQPELFTSLVVVLIGLGAQCGLVWFIHFATRKPEQKQAKKKGGKTEGKAGGRTAGKDNPRR